jgi:amino acid adenylation domain-containing protein
MTVERADVPPPIPRAPDAVAVISMTQAQYWQAARSGPPLGNVLAAARLSGRLNVAAMEEALGALARRHDVLRTWFATVDGAAVPVVAAPTLRIGVQMADRSPLPAGERERAIRNEATAEAAQKIDVATAPLWRATLMRFDDHDHVLLLALHPLVADPQSGRVLLGELVSLHDALSDGRPLRLPDPPLQYADFAAWQRSQMHAGEWQAEIAWWTDRLASAPRHLELPTKHPSATSPSTTPLVRHSFVVPPATVSSVSALARAENTSLYVVLLAAFQMLLARYTDENDVVVAGTTSGRTRTDMTTAVGPFRDTVALRTDLSGDPTVRELVRRVAVAVAASHDHQGLPWAVLRAEADAGGTIDVPAGMQIMFELQDPSDFVLEGGRLEASAIQGLPQPTTAALALALSSTADAIAGELSYCPELFDAEVVARLAVHFERVLAQGAGNPDMTLSQIDLLDTAERQVVTVDWKQTTVDLPDEQTIHRLFEQQVARNGDAVAVTYGAAALTFGELDARANQLARALRAMGVGPEVRVGLCMERSLELLVAIVGVLKAGGAYVPVDPAHPADRLSWLLGDSGVRVVLSDARLKERLRPRDGVLLLTVDDLRTQGAASTAPVNGGATGANLCYVIYTSGSTGQPKGVAMHHRGVCNYIDWGIRAYAAASGNGAPVFTSMAVDLTITNLLPLFAGGAVHLVQEESPLLALADMLRQRRGFAFIKITPMHVALLNSLLAAEDLEGTTRTLVIGADFLSAEPTVPWQEHAPGVRLMNEYGPTETVVGCSAYVIPPMRYREGPVPVGGPIQNLRFYVLDSNLRPTPAACPGELYIGGAGVARGYLDRRGLSAERFIADPFGAPGDRMYRTGDRARWVEPGNLLILGRTDRQVKIRGFRVELAEVESWLRRCPGVSDCLVTIANGPEVQ